MTDKRLARDPTSIQLVTHNGKQVSFTGRPLDDDTLEELSEWIRSEYMRRASAACKGLPSEHVERILSAAAINVPTMDYLDRGLGSRMMSSIDGLAYVLWLSVREDHRDASPKSLRSLMSIRSNMAEAARYWMAANLGIADDAGGDKQPTGEDESEQEPNDTDS